MNPYPFKNSVFLFCFVFPLSSVSDPHGYLIGSIGDEAHHSHTDGFSAKD